MGDIVIRLRGNLASGDREVIVEYESDEDQTPLEHERRHREIVEQLIANGVVTRESADTVRFEPRAEPRDGDALSQDA